MKFKKWHFVYQTINLINGKIYVGAHTSYVDPHKKFDGYLGSGKAIRKAIKKYGSKNFKRSVIAICSSPKEAYKLERSITKDIIKYKIPSYILIGGGGGCLGHNEATRKKMSKAHKGKKLSEETKKILSEQRKGSKNYNYGKKASLETRRKMSASKIGNTNRLGIPHSDESKCKMSKAKIGRNNSMYGVIREKIPCPYCEKKVDVANFARWHGENCKYAN